MNKNTLNLFLIIVGLFCFSSSTFAQSRDDYQESSYNSTTFRDRVFVGSYFSNPNIIGNTNGSQINFGIQPFAGYRFNEFIASGLAFKFDYTYLWGIGTSESFTDFSATVFTRATLAQRIILQLDGGLYSNQSAINSFTKVRNNFPVLFVGGGYSWGRTEVILAYEVLGNLMNYRFPFEYKIGIIFAI